MKYYLIAGEASGDLHGSNLMKGILKADPGARFRFWGGDKMAAVGGAENLAMHYEKASFMGFTEVLKNLRTIFGQIEQCKRDVAAYAPDVLVLIDYAGFNLRLARFGRERGIPTYYYIAPKVWAWKESRVKKIRRWVDRLFVIFPFEVEYFRRRGIEAIYEGNPLMDAIDARRAALGSKEEFRAVHGLDGRPVVACLAGQPALGDRLQSAVHGRVVGAVSAVSVRRGGRAVARPLGLRAADCGLAPCATSATRLTSCWPTARRPSSRRGLRRSRRLCSARPRWYAIAATGRRC